MPNPVMQQIHIDVARNATDDFNPFHDPNRWQNIHRNPFDGPIALGFQLAALALDRISLHRRTAAESELTHEHQLRFSNYQFAFASAVTVGAELEVGVRPTSNRIQTKGELSNRVIVKQNGRLALMGSRKDSRQPAIDLQVDPTLSPSDDHIADRSFLPDSDYFLKRKYLMTSNGKNFCAGCFIPQHHYFDELADKVYFPPSFILSLISCALLERAWQEGHNFEATPCIYTNHRFSFDKKLQRELRSNDRIHLLVSGARSREGEGGLGGSAIPQVRHDCVGMLDGDRVLFRGEVGLAELQDVLAAQ